MSSKFLMRIWKNSAYDCGFFISSLVPCRHICAIFSTLSGPMRHVTNLAPRWRLNNHPLYAIVPTDLGLSSNACATAYDDHHETTGEISSPHERSPIDAAVYETHKTVRYRKLIDDRPGFRAGEIR
jgi:hypothetical protein